MRIGLVAQEAGVGVETIRFYERKGLIERPDRPKDGGHRTYCTAVVRSIRFIRRAQKLGFSLQEIDQLLSLQADPASECGDVRAQAQEKLREVEEKIDELHRIRSALEDLIAICPGEGALKACSIIEALDADDTSIASPNADKHAIGRQIGNGDD